VARAYRNAQSATSSRRDSLKKKKPSKRAKVIKLTPRRREAMGLAKFIDTHGGKLARFRGHGAIRA
jgi:hypothetical protein